MDLPALVLPTPSASMSVCKSLAVQPQAGADYSPGTSQGITRGRHLENQVTLQCCPGLASTLSIKSNGRSPIPRPGFHPMALSSLKEG